MAASMSKVAYLKRYMSKEDLADYKMKQKIKKKVMSDLEKRDKGEEQGLSTSGVISKGFKKSEKKKKTLTVKRRHDSGSDESPTRKIPSGSISHDRSDSESDHSPPRKTSMAISSHSKTRHDSDSDHSPPRKNFSGAARCDSDSDPSPPRKNSSANTSQKRHDSDSDQSPRRKMSPRPTSKRRHDSASDQSPPRKNSSLSVSNGLNSDQSPPRRKQKDSDSDQSPPRHRQPSTSRKRDRPSRFTDLSPKDKNSAKATKTLSGATAGLSSAVEMRREAKKMKDKEERSFQKIDDETLGKNAKTVVRDRETGKRRNLQAEREANAEEDKKKEEQRMKYEQWGKGLSQQHEKERQLADQVHEASKPLARYHDDKDLDEMLRKEERAEDPMLAFIRKKKSKEDSKNGKGKAKKELPKYKGPTPPPPNRYNILPGYRWDGVDRSNGFENKVFANINNKKAIQEMAYKWSTEDM